MAGISFVKRDFCNSIFEVLIVMGSLKPRCFFVITAAIRYARDFPVPTSASQSDIE